MLFNDLWSSIIFGCFSLIIVVIVRILLNCNTAPKPTLFFQETSDVIRKIISNCHCLRKSYVPVYLWGKNGHIQTILFAIFGRIGKIGTLERERFKLSAKDGTTVTYDIFDVPTGTKIRKHDVTIVVIPGICNHSDSTYIKAFSSHMVNQGFEVAVLNHTGALKTVELTIPKIFDYGQTDDFDMVVQALLSRRKNKKLIAIGFSLGANILMKYLGEKPERQKHFHFAAMIFQSKFVLRFLLNMSMNSYVLRACTLLKKGENLRWLYYYQITKKMLKVILQHKNTFERHSSSSGMNLNWQKIASATALHELDAEFTMKIAQENNQDQYYMKNSCSQYMKNIHIPMLILNAKDDPMVPEVLFKYPKSLVEANPNAMFIVTEHGGHLGFFEGGYLIPNLVSWLDRMLAEYINVTYDIVRHNDSTNLTGNEDGISFNC